MSEDKIYGWIGLARKAGKLVAGDALCEEAISRKRSRLVIIAEDCGENTRKRFELLCAKAEVGWVVFGTKAALGQRLGRDTYAVVSVQNKPFATQILKCMNDTKSGKKAHGGGVVE